MNYRIEIWQLGNLVAQESFDRLEPAKRLYRRFIRDDDYGVEVYVKGKRLRAPQAWELMGGNSYDLFFYGSRL